MFPTAFPTRNEERGMSTVAWILNIALAIVGPGIVYALYASRSKFVAFHAMQSLLMGAALTVAGLVGMVFGFVTFGFGLVIVTPLLVLLGIADLILSILIGVRAANGEWAEVPIIGKYARRIVGA